MAGGRKMYVSIDTKFFDKGRKKAEEESEEDSGEKGEAQWSDIKEEIEEIYIDEGKLHMSISSKLGYFSLDIPLNDDLTEGFIEDTIKKFNKYKTLLQSVK